MVYAEPLGPPYEAHTRPQDHSPVARADPPPTPLPAIEGVQAGLSELRQDCEGMIRRISGLERELQQLNGPEQPRAGEIIDLEESEGSVEPNGEADGA